MIYNLRKIWNFEFFHNILGDSEIFEKKSFSMFLRLEIVLSAVSYERKNIIFYENKFNLAENNTCNNVVCNRISPYYRFLPIF